MPRKNRENPLEAEALALAQKGIEAGARGRHAEAVEYWAAALDYADAQLPGADIGYWIKSGLGAALHETGDDARSIAVSRMALDWCSARGQPLPALTMAKSYRRLGDAESAQTYLDHARGLVGDSILREWEAG